jgi:hypothetical protein
MAVLYMAPQHQFLEVGIEMHLLVHPVVDGVTSAEVLQPRQPMWRRPRSRLMRIIEASTGLLGSPMDGSSAAWRLLRRARQPPKTTAQQRKLLFETWEATGNVTAACRKAHVGRGTFYYWKPRFDEYGYAGDVRLRSGLPRAGESTGNREYCATAPVRLALDHLLGGARRNSTQIKQDVCQFTRCCDHRIMRRG